MTYCVTWQLSTAAMQWSSVVNAEEYSLAWQQIQKRELFELDIDDNTLLIGWQPDQTQDDHEEVFSNVLVSSLAYKFLYAAWSHHELEYVVAINGIVVGFRSPFGWSFLTPNSYVAGNMPRGWRELHQQGNQLLIQLLSETSDSDYTDES